MSKPRLQMHAIIDTTDHANIILSAINNIISGKDIFKKHFLSRNVIDETQPERIANQTIDLDIRFNKIVERDSVLTFIQDQAKDSLETKNWFQTGTNISWHTCTHDDEERNIQPCYLTNYFKWHKDE